MRSVCIFLAALFLAGAVVAIADENMGGSQPLSRIGAVRGLAHAGHCDWHGRNGIATAPAGTTTCAGAIATLAVAAAALVDVVVAVEVMVAREDAAAVLASPVSQGVVKRPCKSIVICDAAIDVMHCNVFAGSQFIGKRNRLIGSPCNRPLNQVQESLTSAVEQAGLDRVRRLMEFGSVDEEA
ncbi:hypothetical protein BSKO_12488 [Bryopsis sp. KO-2023]|nr:hypothetical protein BSKO_12488 [Bryopsis sp. KO-2023]